MQMCRCPLRKISRKIMGRAPPRVVPLTIFLGIELSIARFTRHIVRSLPHV